MKKSIGSVGALYPVPVIVVGAMDGAVPTWTLVAHTGIPSHDRLMVSLAKPHFINGCIKREGALTVNVVDRSWLDRADIAGSVSGARQSKAGLFAWTAGACGAPVAEDAKLAMELKVEDIYECGNFENFICSIAGTYAEEAILNEKGRPDFCKLSPVLFEMPSYSYIATGERIAGCLSFAKASGVGRSGGTACGSGAAAASRD